MPGSSPGCSTAKLAQAIAGELGASGRYSLIGFGSGIFDGKHHPDLLALAERLPPARRAKAFIFSTCGAPAGFAQGEAFSDCVAMGYEIAGEFSCPGFNDNSFLKLFGGINRGRPNESDLASARAFAAGLED